MGLAMAGTAGGIVVLDGEGGRRIHILLDGELFNGAELRRDIEARGRTLRDGSDAALIGEAFLAWGVECLRRLDGIWALAIWDAEQRSLLLARDRFGEKPLHFHTNGARLIFASEIKAFLALEEFSPALDADAALAGDGAGAATLLKGVSRVLPGTALAIGADGRVVQYGWWDIRAHLPTIPALYQDQVAQLRDLLRDAVARRHGDAQCLLLSGGLGAAALAAFCGPMTAITGRFGDGTFDEGGQARLVAEHLGLNPVERLFGPGESASLAAHAIWAGETPFEQSALPFHGLCKAAATAGHRRLYCGAGANEQLMGQLRHLDWPMGEVPIRSLDALSKRLPNLLAAYEACATAAECDLVLPFLDWRIAAYCLALPAESKAGAGQTQRVLRDAAAGLIPDAVRLRRTKIGLEAPARATLAALAAKADSHPLWRDPAWAGSDPGSRVALIVWHRLFVEQCGPERVWG